MKHFATLLLAFALAAPVGAQTVTQTASPGVDIPDDGYIGLGDENDGTGEDAGMACAALDFSGQDDIAATGGVLDIDITHTWIGDLTIKIQSPAGTVLPVMARPLGDNVAQPVDTDDGEGCCGDSSNLVEPLSFADGNANDADLLGNGPGNDDPACTGDSCLLFPNPAAAAGGTPDYIDTFAGFDGEMTSGTWTVCVGDAVGADTGTFNEVTLSFAVAVAVDEAPSGEFAFGLVGANPFSTSTALGLRTTTTQPVRASLHDMLGREVAMLFEGTAVAGAEMEIAVSADALPAGTYVVRVSGETFSTTQSLSVVR